MVHKVTDITVLTKPISESPVDTLKAYNQIKVQNRWGLYLNVLRQFFIQQGFQEIVTPTLVPSPGLEPFLEPFKTEYKVGSQKKPFYLPTSPEFHLKKALSQGYENIFEIKECFRNGDGENSDLHNPEFLMLEWYRAYVSPDDVISDIKSLLAHLSMVLKVAIPALRSIRMSDLWILALDYELTPRTTKEDLRVLCSQRNVHFQVTDSFDDLFNRLFLQHVEPWLAQQPHPYVVRYYPASQAALSRITPDGWADRFEFYWKGLELANAFHELNDPIEQKNRFEAEQQKKIQMDKEVVPIDEGFMKALEWGLPPSVGIALGVERLFMAITDMKSIKDVRLFQSSL
jgi:lysyl-tRNA synthetase class 2